VQATTFELELAASLEEELTSREELLASLLELSSTTSASLEEELTSREEELMSTTEDEETLVTELLDLGLPVELELSSGNFTTLPSCTSLSPEQENTNIV
jgi:hypothetical protein